MTNQSCGYFYIAVGMPWVKEAAASAYSLKRFTKFPICLITDQLDYKNEIFDIILYEKMETNFVSKIYGLQHSPFERNVFLDTDTFVCSNIDNLFNVLDLYDISLCTDSFVHSYNFIDRYQPNFKIRYEGVLPQYNTGVIVYNWNDSVKKLVDDWLVIHQKMGIPANMPSFREAVIDNYDKVKVAILPHEYNFHGTLTFRIAYTEIKIIHDRLQEKKGTITRVMASFDKMEQIAKKMNKTHVKRLIVPYFGAIPYNYSPYKILRKIKKMLAVKQTRKSDTL